MAEAAYIYDQQAAATAFGDARLAALRNAVPVRNAMRPLLVGATSGICARVPPLRSWCKFEACKGLSFFAQSAARQTGSQLTEHGASKCTSNYGAVH